MEFAQCTQDALGVLVNEPLRIAFTVRLAGSRIFTHREKVGQELRHQCSRKRNGSCPFVSHWLGEGTVVPGPASACRAQYTVRQRNNEEHETTKKTLSQNARQVQCKIYADTECAAHLRASAGEWDAKAEEKWSHVVRTKKGRRHAQSEAASNRIFEV